MWCLVPPFRWNNAVAIGSKVSVITARGQSQEAKKACLSE
jgi:hypothetical protein